MIQALQQARGQAVRTVRCTARIAHIMHALTVSLWLKLRAAKKAYNVQPKPHPSMHCFIQALGGGGDWRAHHIISTRDWPSL